MYFFAMVDPVGDLYVEKVLLYSKEEEVLFVLIDEAGNRYICSKTSELPDVGLISWIFVSVGEDELINIVRGREDYRQCYETNSGYLISYSEDLGMYIKEFHAEKQYAVMLPAYQVDGARVEHDALYIEELKRAADKRSAYVTLNAAKVRTK